MTVQVPHDGAGVTKPTREVFALSVGRGDEPDIPEGWVQLGVDENGQPLLGYVGPRSPRWDFKDAEDMRRRWG